MRYEPLSHVNLSLFKEFCVKHKPDLDDSFLTEEDLSEFVPSPESPTCLAFEGDKLVAAASLLMDEYHLRGKRARFRILFSEIPDSGIYRTLLDAVRPEKGAVDSWFLFVRDGAADLMACVREAGFHLERTSHILVREALPVAAADSPDGYGIRPFAFGQDEEAYAEIRNAAFANLMGSSTPLTVKDVAAMEQDGDAIPGGIFFLEEAGRPIGVVRTVRDPGEGEDGPMLEIGPLAILPGFQGKGFGTLLLRHALRFGTEQAALPRAVLSVNAENAPALGLYLREGFTVLMGLSCMQQDLL